MDRPRVRIYTDYKSPYAFVANKRLFELEEKLGVRQEPGLDRSRPGKPAPYK